jgi:hypothetical protein
MQSDGGPLRLISLPIAPSIGLSVEHGVQCLLLVALVPLIINRDDVVQWT